MVPLLQLTHAMWEVIQSGLATPGVSHRDDQNQKDYLF